MKRTKEGTKATKIYQIENRITPKAPRALLTKMARDTGFPSTAHSALLNFYAIGFVVDKKYLVAREWKN